MYYPNLRLKRGEKIALKKSEKSWENEVTVIWHFEDEDELATSNEGVNSNWSGCNILNACGHSLPDAEGSLCQFLDSKRFCLAVSPDQLSSMTPAVSSIFAQNPFIRIEVEQISNILADAQKAVSDVQEFGGFEASPTIILDLLEVTEQTKNHANTIAASITYIQQSIECTKVILAGGAFPSDVSFVIGVQDFLRHERQLFDTLKNEYALNIDYSDWCTIHPEWNFSGVRRTGHSSIRYTHDDKWLVFRQNGRDRASVISLTQTLLIHPDYRGPGFSWADAEWHNKVYDSANTGPGNPTNHTSEAIHHHIAQVLT